MTPLADRNPSAVRYGKSAVEGTAMIAVTVALISERLKIHDAMCLDCLASATHRDQADVMVALQMIGETLRVHTDDRACAKCGTTVRVVSLTDSGR